MAMAPAEWPWQLYSEMVKKARQQEASLLNLLQGLSLKDSKMFLKPKQVHPYFVSFLLYSVLRSALLMSLHYNAALQLEVGCSDVQLSGSLSMHDMSAACKACLKRGNLMQFVLALSRELTVAVHQRSAAL